MSSTRLGWKRCAGPVRLHSSMGKSRAHFLTMGIQREGWLLHKSSLDTVRKAMALPCVAAFLPRPSQLADRRSGAKRRSWGVASSPSKPLILSNSSSSALGTGEKGRKWFDPEGMWGSHLAAPPLVE